jgi:hypothetical protein
VISAVCTGSVESDSLKTTVLRRAEAVRLCSTFRWRHRRIILGNVAAFACAAVAAVGRRTPLSMCRRELNFEPAEEGWTACSSSSHRAFPRGLGIPTRHDSRERRARSSFSRQTSARCERHTMGFSFARRCRVRYPIDVVEGELLFFFIVTVVTLPACWECVTIRNLQRENYQFLSWAHAKSTHPQVNKSFLVLLSVI